MRIAEANWPFALVMAFVAVALLVVLEFFADRAAIASARDVCSGSDIDYVGTDGWGAWIECTALEGEADGAYYDD